MPYIAAACKGGDRKRSPVGQKPLQGQGGEGARSTLAGRRSISLEATGGMPVLEGRATLHAIKHVLGRQSGFSKRHLVLSDYMSAIGAIGKGRGKTFGLRHVTQQIGALLLGSGSSVNLRWIPSEMNPADGPSRGSLFPSKYSGCLGVMVLRRLIVVGTPAKKTQKNAKQGKPSAPSTRSRQNRRPLGHVKVGQPKSKRYQKGGRLQLMLHQLPKETLSAAMAAFHRREATLRSLRVKVMQPSPASVFLEIFSGCGRLGRGIGQYNSICVLLWDITLGQEYGLLLPSKQHRIAEWLRCGWIEGFHLGTPCEGCSRARDVPPGPPPLRSAQR